MTRYRLLYIDGVLPTKPRNPGFRGSTLRPGMNRSSIRGGTCARLTPPATSTTARTSPTRLVARIAGSQRRADDFFVVARIDVPVGVGGMRGVHEGELPAVARIRRRLD